MEAFRDGDAGRVHVESEHSPPRLASMPDALLETPKIVSQAVEQDGWNEMSELSVNP